MNVHKLFMTTVLAGAVGVALAEPAELKKSSTLEIDPTMSANIVEPTMGPHNRGHIQPDENRYIVKFKDSSVYSKINSNGIAELNSKQAIQNISKAGGDVKLTLTKSNALAAVLSPAVKRKLEKDPNIELIEKDHVRYLMAETVPYGISMVQATQVSDAPAAATAGGKKVCVIDSGLDLPHEDFGTQNGTINGTNNSGTGNWYDQGGPHGTHVAGTIAALNNGLGVRGVIGSDPDMHIIKVFNSSGWGYTSSLVSAIQRCADVGSDVVNMSLGGSGSSQTEANAMQSLYDQGVLLVAAAGNSGSPSRSVDGKSYPASYDAVMSVAAIDSNKSLASFSQKNDQVEIAGPGVQTFSTYPMSQGAYGNMSGTSMASPHVAGVATLVWSHHPSCTAQEIRSVLNATAQDLGAAGRDFSYGYGLVQAKDAIDFIAANGCDGSTGGGGTPPPTDNALTNGQTESNLSASTGNELFYTLEVPAGATDLSFVMSGGSGDADLYVRFGSKPTTAAYDCRPYRNGNSETCNISNVQAGTYHVMVRAYSSFSGVNLTGSFTEASGGGGGAEGGSASLTNLSGSSGAWEHYTLEMPAGMSTFTVAMSGGSGDADLYVRYGAQPTTSAYDCRPYRNGNNETCNISNPQAGTWHISIRGYSAYSGVNLDVNWQP
ncbi:MAG: S8 family serine peptidase [Kangiellaceae bacterium]|jgi:serine protease|nr:S8 family serine peptidase [Kangiellaceae bacterium]